MKIKSIKFVKSALSILLVVMMLMSAGLATITAATVDLVSTGARVIYYNNTNNWSTPTAHHWGGATGDTKWPGDTMTKVEGTVYSVSIPDDRVNIIFSNNGSSQTANLELPTDGKNYYDNGTWKIYPTPDGASEVYLAGSYNSWSSTANNMTYTDDLNIVEITLELTAGNYEFKFVDSGAWKTNTGTITDEITDWWETYDNTQNIKLTATGGTYIFQYRLSDDHFMISKAVEKVTATFVNYDGTTVLDTDEVESGSTPTYSGATPTKPADAQYTYTFSGWDPELGPITTNTTFTAQFTETVNQYTATFKDATGGTASTMTEDYGTKITLPAGPAKAADDTYVYNFTNWTCSADSQTYSAGVKYELKSNVTFTPNYSQSIKGIDVDIVNTDAKGTVSWNNTQSVSDASGVINVPSGTTNTTLTITPDSGFYVSSVKVGTTEKITTPVAGAIDVNIGTINSATTVTVTYTANPKVTVSQTGGTVTGTGSVEYNSGKQVTITAPDGKYISAVTGATGTYSSNNTVWTANLTNITSDVSISATYADKPTVTVTQTGGTGTVKVNGATYTGAVTVEYNSNATVAITAPTGHYISKYGTTTNTNQTLTSTTATISAIKSSTTYAITYAPIDYDVTVKVTPTAGGTATGEGQYAYGSEVTLKATEKTGYTFTKWDLSGSYTLVSGYALTDSEIKITVKGDVTAEATFLIKTYTVTFVDGQGNTLGTPQTVEHGSAANAPANPTRTGYTFAGWDKAFSSITANTTVTATWTANTYTVSVIDVANGTATATPASYTYNDSTSVTLTATADDGYGFTGWTITGDYELTGGSSLSDTTITIRPNGANNSTVTAKPSFAEGRYVRVYYYSNHSEWRDKLYLWDQNESRPNGLWGSEPTPTSVTIDGNTWYYVDVKVPLSSNYINAKLHGTQETDTIELTPLFSNGEWAGVTELFVYAKEYYGSFYYVTDRSDLSTALASAKSIYEAGNQNYTPESWTAFETAYNNALTAYGSYDTYNTSDQATLDSLAQTLNNTRPVAQTYYNVSFTHSGATGTVQGNTQVVSGNSATFTVTAPDGFYVSSISGASLSGSITPGKVVEFTINSVTADTDVTITYTANPTITVNQTGGTVDGDGKVEYGANQTVTITAPAGSYISGVTGATGTYSNNSTVYVINLTDVKADVTIDVTYKTKPVVTVTENVDGKVTINGTEQNSATVEYNTKPSITITAPDGYYISSILVNGESKFSGNLETKNTHTLNDTVTANTAVIVTYTVRTEHTVTIEAYDSANGTIKIGDTTVPAEGGTYTFYRGENVTITATSAEGKSIDFWTINDTDGNNGVASVELTNLNENTTVSVTWKDISIYNITVDANPYGAGTATGTVTGNVIGESSITSLKGGTQSTKVEEGGAATFTATVTDKIYKFTGWKITGAYSLTSGSLTDDEITIVPKGDVVVVATYEQAYKAIYLVNDLNWSQPYLHYYGGATGTDWPGEAMTKVEGTTNRWVGYVTLDTQNIQFNPGNNSNEVTYDLNADANKGKNTFSNDTKSTIYPATTVDKGYYLQGTWNGKTYSAYDQVKFDENRDGTYTLTIDVTSAPDGYILVNPSDEKSNFWVPATDGATDNPTTLSKIAYNATHNQVKVPLDMVASPSGYRVTFTFNPEDGSFSWTTVKKVPTTSVYGTDGFKVNDAGDRVGDTYFEIGGAVYDKTSVSHYEKAEVAINEFFSVYTQVNPATGSETGLDYEWYVAGYVVNGTRFVTADSMGNGLYSADIRITAEEADADIVPIYFHTKEYLAYYNIKTTTFYAIVPDGLNNWTDDYKYLAAYTWYYKDGETNSCYAPFGNYPGQLMIPITGLDGVYYTIVEAVAPVKNEDGSTIYVDGVTLNNYNGTTPSNEDGTYVQTYDYYEFLSYTILGRENITFVLENHNDNYNRYDVNETQVTLTNFTFKPLSNYNNEIIDTFGTVMTQEEFDAQVAAGNLLHVVRVGNKNYKGVACGMDHGDGECPLNGQWYVDTYIYDNNGNFIAKCHSYQLSNGNMRETLSAYEGYAAKVSYETDSIVDNVFLTGDANSSSTRYDGEWYADTDNSVTVTISVNVGLTTNEGATFTIATDADGNPTNTAEYGSALVNGAASVSVTRNSKITLLAQRMTGYRFVGWATADGTIFSKNISETIDVAISTSYTAVYQKLEAGYFYLNHYIYNGEGTADKNEIPDAHNGRGDLYVQIENLTQNSDTGLIKENTTYLAAQEGDELRLTIATDPAGIDTFFAWYVNAVNASGLATYEEVGVDSVDNLAMPGNGGTYTNPASVLGEKGLVYFQFMHTVGKQFNLTLYSDMIRVTSEKKLVYKYFDRYDKIKTYVVNYELTPEEIEGFEGNHNRPYTPSDDTISKYAPFVGDYYKDVEWVISEFAQDECLLWAQNKPKSYTVTTVINDEIKVEQVDYNTQFTVDAAEDGGFLKGGYWYEDTNGNKQYDKGVDRIIGNGTWYSYLVTDNRTIGYVPEKLDDFNVTLNEPEFGREQSTDSDGNNKVDKVYVDVVVNMVTPFVYGDGSGFDPYYHGPITDKNMAGNMVTIESLKEAGYDVTFGVLYEHIGNFYVSQYVDENRNADGYNVANKDIVFKTVEEAEAYAKENKGYGVATDTAYLAGLIESGKFGVQKGEDGKNRVYTNYTVADEHLTNKNRYQFMLTMDNTLAYRKAFFNVYAYMTVTAPDKTVTTYISNVQTVNIYETVLTTVA